jgi:DeoR family transcriptional regulator, aga operon transcriptional repressor
VNSFDRPVRSGGVISSVSIRRAERVSSILDRLASVKSLNASKLAAEFGVSAATLRRDLQMLEDQHLLSRTHGGALAQAVAYELPIRYRGGQNREQKLQIAAKAASLLPRGQLTLGLTGGTTTSEVARKIASRVDLTVVTNALNIAAELALRPRIKIIMTGGVARAQSYEVVGPLAEQTLMGLNIQVAVVGVDGISVRGGLTTHDEVEAHTNACMIDRSARCIMVADRSKVGRVLLARICPISRVTELITDDSADATALDDLRRAGVTVHVVPASVQS